MNKEFIPYEQALALKELGFDEPCFAYFYHHQEYKILFDNPTQSRDYNSIKVDVGSIFDNNEERVKKGLESLGDSVSRITSIPTFSQAFRWFREKYKLSGEPQSYQFQFMYQIIYDTLGEKFGDASTARTVAITITGVLKQLEIDKNIDIPEWIDLYERLSDYRL
jgi:hypothetical protein